MSINNAVFIWIPKNAGTSLHRMMGEPPELRRPELIEEHWTHQRLVTFGHIDYMQLLSRGIISPRWNRQAYKFAFCRNPYSRAISLYLYLKRIGIHREDTFLEFCRLVVEQLPVIGFYNFKGLSQCNPQIRWVEKIQLDFLGRVEAFDKYSKILFRNLGDQFDLPEWEPLVLNNSNDVRPAELYCQESVQIVEHTYEEDFKYFNYKKDYNQWISNT